MSHVWIPSGAATPAAPLVNTTASTKVAVREAAMREAAKRTSETIDRNKFIAWPELATKLKKLNPRILFCQLPDAKMAIGLENPSATEVRAWEASGLNYWERREVQTITRHKGPRQFFVAVSRGHISYYKDLITSSFPPQIICRSLRSIIGRCVDHGVCTWEEAEREFGVRFRGPGTHVQQEYVDVRPQAWGERKVITLQPQMARRKPLVIPPVNQPKQRLVLKGA